MKVFFAIKFDEIQDLLRNGVKTFELSGTDHVISCGKLKKGEQVFLTPVSRHDIEKGTEGVIAKVENVTMGYWRTASSEFDEKEILTVRLQVRFVDHGRVEKVKDLGYGNGLEAEVVRHIVIG